MYALGSQIVIDAIRLIEKRCNRQKLSMLKTLDKFILMFAFASAATSLGKVLAGVAANLMITTAGNDWLVWVKGQLFQNSD